MITVIFACVHRSDNFIIIRLSEVRIISRFFTDIVTTLKTAPYNLHNL